MLKGFSLRNLAASNIEHVLHWQAAHVSYQILRNLYPILDSGDSRSDTEAMQGWNWQELSSQVNRHEHSVSSEVNIAPLPEDKGAMSPA